MSDEMVSVILNCIFDVMMGDPPRVVFYGRMGGPQYCIRYIKVEQCVQDSPGFFCHPGKNMVERRAK